MLKTINLDEKSFDEYMKEAVSKIPMYSSEWTNFNQSDPGITTLEILTSLNLMQQGAINNVSMAVKLKLLKMAGFEPKKAQCARVLIGLKNKDKKVNLPVNQKIYVGETCFETNREIQLGKDKILDIYRGSLDSKTTENITYLIQRELPLSCEIYSDHPRSGMFVDIVLSSISDEEDLIFYITSEERVKRNPFAKGQEVLFGKVIWQIWTENGFHDIEDERIIDETYGFLVSGQIRISIPKQKASLSNHYTQEGYLLRALLTDADYDVVPRIQSLEGYLFEVYQKDSIAITYNVEGNEEIELYGGLLDSPYQIVYCLEQNKKSNQFYKYNEIDLNADDSQMEKGRFYKKIEIEHNRYRYVFNRKGKYCPKVCKDAIQIVCYNEKALNQINLGKLYGYDNQLYDLSIQNLYDADFMLMLQYENEIGEMVYSFVSPGNTEYDELNFILANDNRKLLVTNPGIYEGAELFIANMSVFNGEDGNVREWNEYFKDSDKDIKFYNPMKGIEGRKKENIEVLRNRFAKEIHTSDCAVTKEDYERIVKMTPGLAIHKVKAVCDEKKNKVLLVVKPFGPGNMPKLSEIYKKEITNYIEDKRMITTKIQLQSPVYVPIDVHCIVYIKKYAKNSKKKVETLLYENLDYISGKNNFGETIRFSSIFKKIQSIEGVEYVHSLSMKARNNQNVKKIGYDIVLNDNCLCYPGNIAVVINTV